MSLKWVEDETQANCTHRKAGVTTLISEKIDFKIKKLTRTTTCPKKK